jgi:deoxyribodipyrimidine photo-lyase
MSATKRYRRVVVWMRRGLRVQDHAPLWYAIRDAEEVVPVVCLQDDDRYRTATPRRTFLRGALKDLDANLRRSGSRLFVRRGRPEEEIPAAALAHEADAVYATSVYDAPTRERDGRIAASLKHQGSEWVTLKDAVLFEAREVLAASGSPYRVFTPYRNAWLQRQAEISPPFPIVRRIASPSPGRGDTTLDRLPGFGSQIQPEGESAARRRLKEFVQSALYTYSQTRDLPGIDGTSKMSAHLANGTISIRTVYDAIRERVDDAPNKERKSIDVFINELIWREFYYQILANFPFVVEHAFREEFRGLRWSENREHFAAWSEGRTGYPIVDAAMRQLQREGWMHNRARMIVASFLTKDLHINWQRGEQYFFDHLIDADVASNNGGWQWTAGTGTDASPWFRIFNPILQGEKFDPDGAYVRRYVPELSGIPAKAIHKPWVLAPAEQKAAGCTLGVEYPERIVRHEEERLVTLELYRNPRGSSGRHRTYLKESS